MIIEVNNFKVETEEGLIGLLRSYYPSEDFCEIEVEKDIIRRSPSKVLSLEYNICITEILI